MKETKQYGMIIAILGTVTVLVILFSAFALELRDKACRRPLSNTHWRVTPEQFWLSIPG